MTTGFGAIARMLVAGTLLGAGAVNAQAPSGEQLFKQRCQSCHSLAPDGKSGPMAPNLRGAAGAKAASRSFNSYSPALKASGIVWTKANMDLFLTRPTQLVPGTRMVIGVSDPAQRAAIVAFLQAQK